MNLGQYTSLLSNRLLRIFIILGILISFYSGSAVLLMVSLALIYKILSPLLDRTIFNSSFYKGVVSIFVYALILQSTILAAWLVNRNFSLETSILIMFLLLFVVLTFTRPLQLKRPVTVRLPFLHLHDILAVLLSLAIFIPIVSHSLTFNNSGITRNFEQLAVGADDALHLQMFDTRLTYDRGILYESVIGGSTIGGNYYGADTYPAGWSATNATIVQAFYPNISVGSESEVAYILSKLFWFLLLLIIFCRVTIGLYQTLSRSKAFLVSVLLIGTSIYILGRIFVSDVYPAGAYSFVPQLIAALLTIPIILQLSSASRVGQQRDALFLFVLVGIGGCLSWILVLPTFLISFIAIAILRLKNIADGKNILKELLTRMPYCIPIYVMAAACIAQLYVMITSHSPGSLSFIDAINQRAGVMIYDAEFYAILISGLAAFLLFLYKKYRTVFTYIVWLIIPLIAFDAYIVIIQLLHVGEARYYFFKILNLLNMFLLPLAIVGYVLVLDWLGTKKRKFLQVSLFILVFLAFLHVLTRTLLRIL